MPGDVSAKTPPTPSLMDVDTSWVECDISVDGLGTCDTSYAHSDISVTCQGCSEEGDITWRGREEEEGSTCATCRDSFVSRSDSVVSYDASEGGDVIVARGCSDDHVEAFACCAVNCSCGGGAGGIAHCHGCGGDHCCSSIGVREDGRGKPRSDGGTSSKGDGTGHRSLDCGGFCCEVGGGVASDNELDEEGRAVLLILEFPARLSATKERVDLEKAYQEAKKVILSDVVRTDRDSHYFT